MGAVSQGQGVSEGRVKVGRIALRHEGENWNAYYALPDSMEAPIPLGSIRMGAVDQSPEIKQHFIELMREVVSLIFYERFGVRPSWDEPQPAPEHERSGHG